MKRDTIIEFIERTEEVIDETRKLFDITNQYYIAINLALVLICNAFLAYRLVNLFDEQISNDISAERVAIGQQLFDQKNIQNIPFTIGDEIRVEPITQFSMLLIEQPLTDGDVQANLSQS